jgi:hypothetical protein
MDTADGNNTLLSASIMANGVHGPDNASGLFTGVTAFTGLKITDDYTATLPDSYRLRNGTIYKPSVFRSISHDDSQAFKAVYWNVSGKNASMCSVFGLFKVGPPYQGPGGALWDLIRFSSQNSGQFCVFQLDSGSAATTPDELGLDLETNPAGVTSHSIKIPVVAGNSYWFNALADYSKVAPNLGGLALWDHPSGNLRQIVRTTLLGGADAVDFIGDIRIGQDEAGTATATSYFKGLGFDFRDARFPVPPVEAGNAPVFPNSPFDIVPVAMRL